MKIQKGINIIGIKEQGQYWVAVDDLNPQVFANILKKVFDKAECCQTDTLWYDDSTTLKEMIGIQFEKELVVREDD